MNIPHLAKSRDLDNTRTRYCRAFQRPQCGSQRRGGKAVYFSSFCGFIFFYDFFANEGEKSLSLSLSLSSRPSLGARSSSVQSPLLLSSFNVCAGDKDKLVCRIKRNHVEKCIRVFVEFSTSAISKESRRI